MATPATPNQAAGKGLLIAGYIFAFLGGLIGLVIGAHMKWGKITDASGNKVLKYDEPSQKQGLIIFIIGLVSMIIWNIIRVGMR
jgi:hypothetical protein